MNRLVDLLLTTEPVQRVRLAQAGLAMLVMATGVAAMHYFVWVGVAAAAAVQWWAAVTLLGMVGFFGLIRSGRSLKLADPALTVPQILFALTSGAAAYTLLGSGRGAVFPVVMVVLMFGMFEVSPRQMRWLGAYAVLLFGAVMALMANQNPLAYPICQTQMYIIAFIAEVGIVRTILDHIWKPYRIQIRSRIAR